MYTHLHIIAQDLFRDAWCNQGAIQPVVWGTCRAQAPAVHTVPPVGLVFVMVDSMVDVWWDECPFFIVMDN